MNLDIVATTMSPNGTALANATPDNPVLTRHEDAMADEGKDAKPAADEKAATQSKTEEKDAPPDGATGDAPEKKKSGISPLVLIISAVGSLVVFLAVFSYTMGVFDPPPPETPATETEAAATQEPAAEAEYSGTQGYQSDFGRAAAEVAASQDSGAVDTFAALSQFDQRRRELATEEKRIEDERRELAGLKQEVERLLSRQNAIEEEKVLYMAKLLDGMKPDEMTGLVAELDNRMILKVLPKMKPQNASKLLAQLPPKRAAAITTALLDSES